MKSKYKLAFLLFSLAFIGGGLVVKNYSDLPAKGNTGLVAGDSTNLIKINYPDVPLYPNSLITSILEKNGSVFLTLESPDGAVLTQNYYEGELKSAGWKRGTNDFVLDNKKLSLAITPSQNRSQTIVSINYVFVPTK